MLKHKEAIIKMHLIEKYWDQMGQFYASIEQGKITASVALRRLLSLSKKNEFFKANLMSKQPFRSTFEPGQTRNIFWTKDQIQ